MTTEAHIQKLSGMRVDEIIYLVGDTDQVSVAWLRDTLGADQVSMAILRYLEDGYTAVPF